MEDMTHDRREPYPLSENPICSLDTWTSLRSLWDKECSSNEPQAEVLLGLLHRGFEICHQSEIPQEDKVDRICLYLEMAHGYKNRDSDPRGKLTEKAWRMLCQNYFKGEKNIYDFELATNPVVLDKLLWFFKPGFRYIDAQRNIPSWSRNHYEDKAVWYLVGLVRFVWFEYERYHCTDSGVIDYFHSKRPELVGILNDLHKLDILVPNIGTTSVSYGVDFDIDESVMTALRDLALQTDPQEHQVTEDVLFECANHCSTVSEALLCHSQAAQVWTLLEARRIEQVYQGDLKSAQAQVEEGQQALKRVQSR